MAPSRLLIQLARLLILLLLAGFFGAALIRFAPGFGVDEQELNVRLSTESIDHLRQSEANPPNLIVFYLQYVRRAALGDFGTSRLFDRPIAELLADRLPVTLTSAAMGLVGGSALAFCLAATFPLVRRRELDVASIGLAGLFLCLPSALIGLFFLIAGAPVGAGIAAVIFPRVFFYARNLFRDGAALPHVIATEASGQSRPQIFIWHLLPTAAPPLLALLGTSVGVAFGAAIPMEVICDSPGIGQLAWKAALGRDLPLLVALTLVLTTFTLIGNLAADTAIAKVRGVAA